LRRTRCARRLDEILRGNFTDLRPWFPEGVVALQKPDGQAAQLHEALIRMF
jgi:putative component of toxin-antitoxin plasmid stabilization module